jgi:hypothetical protein
VKRSHSDQLIGAYRLTHKRLLQLLDRLDDSQLKWQPNPHAPALVFHFWHIARWADHLQAAMPGMSPILAERLGPGKQEWQRLNVAAAWGWNTEQLGYDATGMGMSDELGAKLSFPPKADLVAYLEQAFAKADRAVEALDDALLLAPERPQAATEGVFGGNTIGDALIVHITHDSRHLGMIEGLLGSLTGRGTATV